VADIYDVIVLGAGSTGENVAERTARAGLTTVIVESELVGGDCSYWACMPSKALLRPSAALLEARSINGTRQAVTGDLDSSAVLQRRNTFTHDWHDDGQVQWLEGAHIDLVRGQGRFTGPNRVEVSADGGTRTLEARQAVAVCTGSEAVVPPIPGLTEARPWTSRQGTSAQEVPRRLAIIGGGVVGCELATVWRSLGSEVTMLIREEAPLDRMEPFARELIASALRDAGVDVRTQVVTTRVNRAPSGEVTVFLEDGATVEVDELLVATGRQPKTSGIGLESVGLEPGSWLEVDDTCRVEKVEQGWLYAAGDVNHKALLTHMGKYQGRICGDAIAARAFGKEVDSGPWGHHAATANHAAVPQVVFTHPEVASVGLTEQAAIQAGLPIRVVEYEIGNVSGASLFGDGYQGHAKLVVDTSRRVVVGCTFVGAGVGELLHSATVAVVGEVPLERLWHAVPSYPTISEVWLRLLETYGL
jgi:dihydrolipoamide dehydrogenase